MLPRISIKSERDREPVLGTSHHCWGPWVVMGPELGVRRLHRLLELNKDDLISQSGVHGPATLAGRWLELQSLAPNLRSVESEPTF